MSLLKSLDDSAPIERDRRGPLAACDIYGDGYVEDARKVDALRRERTWKGAQRLIDAHLGIERPINNDKFRYHWGLRCGHWTDDQKAAGL